MKILNKNPILGLANSYFIDSPQPVNLSYNWNYGSLLGICLIVQIVTGVLLAMHYQPSWDGAFDSVEAIMRDLNNGWLLRYIHANGATFFFIFVYLHMGRGLYYGSYRSPRSAVWLIGVALFLALIITAFLGYVIVLGSMSYWGAAVITNLVSVIPWIGPKVVEFIWGGFSVNEATINRFFALHYLMPFILAALAAMHLLTLHTSGSTNPAQISANGDRIPFSPFFVVKDGVTVLLYIRALLAFVFYLPNFFGEVINYDKADPMKTPLAIVPEWYLLSFYAILRSIPNKLAGVVAMAAAILILALLPILDRAQVKGSQVKPLGQVIFWGFVANFAVLTWIGSCHPEAGFIEVGQVATVIYFAYFLVLIPLCSTLENLKA